MFYYLIILNFLGSFCLADPPSSQQSPPWRALYEREGPARIINHWNDYMVRHRYPNGVIINPLTPLDQFRLLEHLMQDQTMGGHSTAVLSLKDQTIQRMRQLFHDHPEVVTTLTGDTLEGLRSFLRTYEIPPPYFGHDRIAILLSGIQPRNEEARNFIAEQIVGTIEYAFQAGENPHLNWTMIHHLAEVAPHHARTQEILERVSRIPQLRFNTDTQTLQHLLAILAEHNVYTPATERIARNIITHAWESHSIWYTFDYLQKFLQHHTLSQETIQTLESAARRTYYNASGIFNLGAFGVGSSSHRILTALGSASPENSVFQNIQRQLRNTIEHPSSPTQRNLRVHFLGEYLSLHRTLLPTTQSARQTLAADLRNFIATSPFVRETILNDAIFIEDTARALRRLDPSSANTTALILEILQQRGRWLLTLQSDAPLHFIPSLAQAQTRIGEVEAALLQIQRASPANYTEEVVSALHQLGQRHALSHSTLQNLGDILASRQGVFSRQPRHHQALRRQIAEIFTTQTTQHHQALPNEVRTQITRYLRANPAPVSNRTEGHYRTLARPETLSPEMRQEHALQEHLRAALATTAPSTPPQEQIRVVAEPTVPLEQTRVQAASHEATPNNDATCDLSHAIENTTKQVMK